MIKIEGHLAVQVIKPDGSIRDERKGKNVICLNGLTAMAAALVWSGIQDQASNLGVTTPTFMTPLYGAVGDGSGTPANTDTALFAELGRSAVGAGASSPATQTVSAQTTWQFFFNSPLTQWTLTEAGIFAFASDVAGSGTMMDHWAFSPNVVVPTTDTILLQVSFSLGT